MASSGKSCHRPWASEQIDDGDQGSAKYQGQRQDDKLTILHPNRSSLCALTLQLDAERERDEGHPQIKSSRVSVIVGLCRHYTNDHCQRPGRHA